MDAEIKNDQEDTSSTTSSNRSSRSSSKKSSSSNSSSTTSNNNNNNNSHAKRSSKTNKLRNLNNVSYDVTSIVVSDVADRITNETLSSSSSSSTIGFNQGEQNNLSEINDLSMKDENNPNIGTNRSKRLTRRSLTNHTTLPQASLFKKTKRQESSSKKNEIEISTDSDKEKKFFVDNDETTQDGFAKSTLQSCNKNLTSFPKPNAITSSIRITKIESSVSKTDLNILNEESSDTSSSNSKKLNTQKSVDFYLEQTESSQMIDDHDEDKSQSGNTDTGGATVSIVGEKKKRKRRSSIFPTDHVHNEFSVNDLFIYKWPLDEDIGQEPVDIYLLQEQISEYLNVKSFKRKFPDLQRRLIDLKEREYLKENKVVTETQCDLGLTAIKLNDCLDIIVDNYPEKYKELSKHIEEQRRKSMACASSQCASEPELDQTKTLNETNGTTSVKRTGRPALSESEKLKELIRKAIKSVSSYNTQLQKEKKTERSCYFDLQSMTIHKPIHQTNLSNNLNKNPKGKYPVALLEGQYSYYYKRYTSDELKYLPVNTIIYPPPIPNQLLYDQWKQKQQQQNQQHQQQVQIQSASHNFQKPIENRNQFDSSDEEEKIEIDSINTKQLATKNSQHISSILSNANLNSVNASSTIRLTVSAAPTAAKLINPLNKPSLVPLIPKSSINTPVFKTCYICSKLSQISNNSEQIMIGCSSCSRFGHPNCLELNSELVSLSCILKYDWQCMDCKKCSKCNTPHDEEKMMFCDRCDRGFHTYCVGLNEVPSGTWVCNTCNVAASNEMNENLNELALKKLNELSPMPQQRILSAALKQKIANSCSASITTTPTNQGVRTGKRGRPPGSLNKPKDPNSPKKLIKNLINKSINKIELDVAPQQLFLINNEYNGFLAEEPMLTF